MLRVNDAAGAGMMISVGVVGYRIVATERDGHWTAQAARQDTGKPFGIDCAGASEADVVERLTAWLGWQHDHAAALDALQAAQRAYHRTVAGSAFASATAGASALELHQESLEAVDAARVLLDDIRARRPE